MSSIKKRVAIFKVKVNRVKILLNVCEVYRFCVTYLFAAKLGRVDVLLLISRPSAYDINTVTYRIGGGGHFAIQDNKP